MQYAVVETGGKQYRVTPGMTLVVDSLGKDVGVHVNLDKILLLVDEGKTMIGTPYVSGVSVSAKVVSNDKGPKVKVSKFLAKSRYRRVTGFRASLSMIQIADIVNGEKKKTVSVETKEATVEVKTDTKSAPKKATSVKKIAKKA